MMLQEREPVPRHYPGTGNDANRFDGLSPSPPTFSFDRPGRAMVDTRILLQLHCWADVLVGYHRIGTSALPNAWSRKQSGSRRIRSAKRRRQATPQRRVAA